MTIYYVNSIMSSDNNCGYRIAPTAETTNILRKGSFNAQHVGYIRITSHTVKIIMQVGKLTSVCALACGTTANRRRNRLRPDTGASEVPCRPRNCRD